MLENLYKYNSLIFFACVKKVRRIFRALVHFIYFVFHIFNLSQNLLNLVHNTQQFKEICFSKITSMSLIKMPFASELIMHAISTKGSGNLNDGSLKRLRRRSYNNIECSKRANWSKRFHLNEKYDGNEAIGAHVQRTMYSTINRADAASLIEK